jgi:hypothetical protein
LLYPERGFLLITLVTYQTNLEHKEGDSMKKSRFSRFLRAIFVALILVGFSAVAVESATLLPLETFDGTFPPAGWSVTNDDGGPVVWHRSDQTPNTGAAQPLPISGLHAYAESFPAYCGYSYDTSLITPPFSTMGMTNIELRFDYQFWVYSSEVLALDYRIGAGPWTHLEDLSKTGTFIVQSHVVDISVTAGHPTVQLRWRYYNPGAGCDYWTNIDNVEIVGSGTTEAVPTLTEWGMIIFAVLAGLGATYFIKRKRGLES